VETIPSIERSSAMVWLTWVPRTCELMLPVAARQLHLLYSSRAAG
jgi:hypothetical protein